MRAFANSQYMPTWKDRLTVIRKARAELRQYEAIMTPYEKQSISRSIQEQVQRDYHIIFQGAADELNQHISSYQEAARKLERARAAEIASWDSSRLGTEMNTFQMLVDQVLGSGAKMPGFSSGPDAAARLTKLYQEAKDSGDRYKLRAAAEVMQGIRGRVTKGTPIEQAAALGGLARQAESDIEDIRFPDSLLDALDEKQQAATALLQERDAIAEIAEVMGENPQVAFGNSGDLVKLIRRVQQDRQSGEVQVYALDAPEVTGIRWKTNKEN